MENKAHDSKILNQLRCDILEASARSSEGHIPSAFSILDILFCVYLYDSHSRMQNLERFDYNFILSKGHGSLALYAVLSEAGFFDKSWIKDFGGYGSRFGGHPDRNKVPGVMASTGSLGHGLPIAVGVALANRISGKKQRSIVLIGDGELNEGSNWESLLLASHHHLNNLTVIIDSNHSSDRALELGDLESKLNSFGFSTQIIDGHNHIQIVKALEFVDESKPRAIVAKTIKGNGIREMENNPAWHHAFPSQEKLEVFQKDLSV